MALYEFVGHLNRHAFDTFKDGVPSFRGKSSDMRHHVDVMRDLLENVMNYPTLDDELDWDEPKPVSTDEVHGLLLTEIGNWSGIRFLRIAVYWKDARRCFGILELAIDDEAVKPAASLRSKILPAIQSIAGLAGPNPAPISMRHPHLHQCVPAAAVGSAQ
ncbi:hypothetical protein HGP16_26460 [Rhizobium sp. P40RR-XXII]|uniref:hypothetical protein n=1 Tax=Rhizobium sp. P40RR-XXII TaxID=2726739 RepID=UPI0014578B49|nr:hypothetical protein [Rhizobium sp. P40RR-XXII]NLS20083.1 hypothetical protein [Rhizobium sp. P40RR-XXII]